MMYLFVYEYTMEMFLVEADSYFTAGVVFKPEAFRRVQESFQNYKKENPDEEIDKTKIPHGLRLEINQREGRKAAVDTYLSYAITDEKGESFYCEYANTESFRVMELPAMKKSWVQIK